jgi:hypothetical protein
LLISAGVDSAISLDILTTGSISNLFPQDPIVSATATAGIIIYFVKFMINRLEN